MHGFDLDRDIGFELRAVRHVQVDIRQRIPGVHQRQHVLHLGRIGLHVFAVQIVVLRRAAPAHFHGTALVRPVPLAEALMAVDIEDRHEQQHLLVQRARRCLAFQYFAQGQETRVLAVDFPRMDAALYQQHRYLAQLGHVRRQRARVGNGQRQHGAVFRRAAKFKAAHLFRVVLLEAPAQGFHFPVAARLLETRVFGHRLQGKLPHIARGMRVDGKQG